MSHFRCQAAIVEQLGARGVSVRQCCGLEKESVLMTPDPDDFDNSGGKVRAVSLCAAHVRVLDKAGSLRIWEGDGWELYFP